MFQPRPRIFHSAGLMQSGSAEKAAPPSLQPHNKACNYCSFASIHLCFSHSPSLQLPPSLTHLTPSLPRHLPPSLCVSVLPSFHLSLPSPPTPLPPLCPSLPQCPILPLTSAVMSLLCGVSGKPLHIHLFFGRFISQSIIMCVFFFSLASSLLWQIVPLISL